MVDVLVTDVAWIDSLSIEVAQMQGIDRQGPSQNRRQQAAANKTTQLNAATEGTGMPSVAAHQISRLRRMCHPWGGAVGRMAEQHSSAGLHAFY